jgi:hypothetical protein
MEVPPHSGLIGLLHPGSRPYGRAYDTAGPSDLYGDHSYICGLGGGLDGWAWMGRRPILGSPIAGI